MTDVNLTPPARTPWLRLAAHPPQALAQAEQRYGLKLTATCGRAVTQEAGFLLLPLVLIGRHPQGWREERLLLALGRHTLISVEPPEPLAAWAQVACDLRTTPCGPVGILLALLEALNDAARLTITDIAARLNARSEAVAAASGGFESSGQQPGVADIADTAIALGEAEELIAKIVESQAMLARASRWLRRAAQANGGVDDGVDDGINGGSNHEARATDAKTMQRLTLLLAEIHSLSRHARFQHDKIRNLQQSLMTTLDLKQNQIIKLFTVVTAVFTPPTLIAAFYGQNFAYMPELEIPWGEWLMIAMTGVFALLPLVYVKRKGWMR